MANQLIQKLLDAEQQADTIVRRAKENWVKKLKEAQVSAEEEIVKFRAHEEEKFNREFADKYGGAEGSEQLEDKTKNEIEKIKEQYKKNRDQAIALLITGCVRVDTSLSQAQVRQMKILFSERSAGVTA